MATSNGTPPLYHGTQPWFPTMAPSNATLPWNCKSAKVRTQPWHHSNGRHPTMAPYHVTQQWHPAMAPHYGTLPWHPALAPCSHVQSAKVVRRSPSMTPCHGTRQWHPAMAPGNGAHNGTTSSPLKVGRHPPLPTIALTMAPSNGTQQWHPAMAPGNGAL